MPAPFKDNKYMTELHNKKCISCDGSIPAFDKSEIHKYLKKVDGWDVKSDHENSYYLIKEFKFKNFKDSQIFTNKIGIIIPILFVKIWLSLKFLNLNSLIK